MRLVHAILFFGFTAATVAATQVELMQLWRALVHPFHSGTPPAVIPCVSGIVSMLCAAVLLVRLVLGKPISIAVSIVMLLAAAGSFTMVKAESKERSMPGANLRALEAAGTVRAAIDGPLQKTGKVPKTVDAPMGVSPYRRRGFASMPWRVEPAKRTDALPDGAEPGWILFHASDDQTSFSLSCVGVDIDGQPAILRDEHGVAVEIKGAFNPDTPG